MSAITIVDESLQGEKRAWSLDLLTETISLRELIRRRVYQEVSEYNAKPAGSFYGLVQPADAERTLNGSHLKTPHQLNWLAQYERAIAAFSRRSYIVLVDEMQVDDLDASIELQTDSQATFIRLVPLVGG